MLPAKQAAAWRFALARLDKQVPVMLLYVVESIGSSPGRQGFFLLIDAAGHKEGSIGGGIMEHKFIEWAKDHLRQNIPLHLLRRQVHDKEAPKDQSGMICSGEQTILLYSLEQKDRPAIQQILQHPQNGCLEFSPAGMRFNPQPPRQNFFFQKINDKDWVYREKTGYTHYLYIVGGGHVALAFSRLMQMMDFHITLLDDRTALDSFEQNHFVQEKVKLDDYNRLTQLIPGGPDRFVVVMTQGYRTDDLAIHALWKKDFRYFGILGSKAKIQRLLASWRLEGIPEERIKKLRAPAGLPIQSQTPEEIAVSIAAEIIRHRHTPE